MTLEQRVVKLERQNRWLRRGGAVVVAVFAVVVFVGQAADAEKVIKARQFIVVDENGEQQASLGMAQFYYRVGHGPEHSFIYPELCIGRKREMPCAVLACMDGDPSLALGTKDWELAVFIANNERGMFRWRRLTTGSHQMLEMTLTEEDGLATVCDAEGKVIWQAPPKKEAPK